MRVVICLRLWGFFVLLCIFFTSRLFWCFFLFSSSSILCSRLWLLWARHWWHLGHFYIIEEVNQLGFHVIFLLFSFLLFFFRFSFFLLFKNRRFSCCCVFLRIWAFSFLFGFEKLRHDFFIDSWLDPASELKEWNSFLQGLRIEHIVFYDCNQVHVRAVNLNWLTSLIHE